MDCIIENPHTNYNLKLKFNNFISISALSLLLLYYFPSSILHNSLSHFFNLHYYFCTLANFPLRNRNCMFLICNGILAILAKNLRLTATSPNGQITEMPLEDERLIDYSPKSLGISEEVMKQELIQTLPQSAVMVVENDKNYEAEGKQVILVEVREREVRACLAVESEEYWEQDEGEEDKPETSMEEIDAQCTIEGLNRKFEEFIKKMKDGLRVEARNTTM